MKEKIKTKHTHTHIPKKRQANYLQKKKKVYFIYKKVR